MRRPKAKVIKAPRNISIFLRIISLRISNPFKFGIIEFNFTQRARLICADGTETGLLLPISWAKIIACTFGLARLYAPHFTSGAWEVGGDIPYLPPVGHLPKRPAED